MSDVPIRYNKSSRMKMLASQKVTTKEPHSYIMCHQRRMHVVIHNLAIQNFCLIFTVEVEFYCSVQLRNCKN